MAGKMRFHFTIRALLILTTLVAVFLSLSVSYPAVALVLAIMLPLLVLAARYALRRKPFVAIGWICSAIVVYALSIGPVFAYYLSRDEPHLPDPVFRAYRPLCHTVSPTVICSYMRLWGVPDIVMYFVLCDYFPEKSGQQGLDETSSNE
jgi:4-hydroxybenzoate polyprenyltransferase